MTDVTEDRPIVQVGSSTNAFWAMLLVLATKIRKRSQGLTFIWMRSKEMVGKCPSELDYHVLDSLGGHRSTRYRPMKDCVVAASFNVGQILQGKKRTERILRRNTSPKRSPRWQTEVMMGTSVTGYVHFQGRSIRDGPLPVQAQRMKSSEKTKHMVGSEIVWRK